MASGSGTRMNPYPLTRMDLHGTPNCPWYCYCHQLLKTQTEIENSPFWFKEAPQGYGLSDSEDEDIPPGPGKNDLSKSAGANAPFSSNQPRFTAGGSNMEAANPGLRVSLQQIKAEPEEMDQNEPGSNDAPYIPPAIAVGTTTTSGPSHFAVQSLFLVDWETGTKLTPETELVPVDSDEEVQDRRLVECVGKAKEEIEKSPKSPKKPEYWKDYKLKKPEEKEGLQAQETMTLQKIKEEDTDMEDETWHDRDLHIHMSNSNFRSVANNISRSYDNRMVKRFHCELCNETFAGQSSFARHMKLHDKCVYCHDFLEPAAGQTSEKLMCSNCENKLQEECYNPPMLALPAPPPRTGNSFNAFDEDSKSTDDMESVCEPDDDSDEDYMGATRRGRSSSRSVKAKPKSRLENGKIKKICEVCGKSFVYPARYIAHRLKHDNSTLKLEVNRNQPGPRVHMCKERGCTETFGTRSAARAHLTVAHLQNSPFSCGECGEKFRKQHHLDHHKTKHEPKGELTCGVCGKMFKSRSSLRSHERRSTHCSRSLVVMVNENNVGSEFLKVTKEDGSVENIRYSSSANSLLSEVPLTTPH